MSFDHCADISSSCASILLTDVCTLQHRMWQVMATFIGSRSLERQCSHALLMMATAESFTQIPTHFLDYVDASTACMGSTTADMATKSFMWKA
jgi:hypothetical protein